MVIQERATLEHAVTKLSEQRNNTMTQINQHQEKERFLRTQLKEATSELNRYRIDLNEKERITSDVMERNEHLNQRLEHTRTTEGSIRSQVNQARDMTAAMASESETLRHDNARLLQLADAARTRIEELEHRLRVTIGQLNTCTNQMESLELMLIAERNERARSESKSHELQGKVMYQEGEEGDHIRTITKSLQSERDRSRVLEGKLRQRECVIEEQKERAERFEMMTKKYTKELQEHENNIEKLEMRASGASSGRGSRGSDEEEEE